MIYSKLNRNLDVDNTNINQNDNIACTKKRCEFRDSILKTENVLIGSYFNSIFTSDLIKGGSLSLRTSDL